MCFLSWMCHSIGHSYFLKIKDNATVESLTNLFKKEIIPLLMEYFYGDVDKVKLVLGDNKDWSMSRKLKFLVKKNKRQNELFGVSIDGYDDKETYEYYSFDFINSFS